MRNIHNASALTAVKDPILQSSPLRAGRTSCSLNARRWQKTAPAQTQACRKNKHCDFKKAPCVDSLESDDDDFE